MKSKKNKMELSDKLIEEVKRLKQECKQWKENCEILADPELENQ